MGPIAGLPIASWRNRYWTAMALSIRSTVAALPPPYRAALARQLELGAGHSGLNEPWTPCLVSWSSSFPGPLQPPNNLAFARSRQLSTRSQPCQSRSVPVADGSPVILSGGRINRRTRTVSPRIWSHPIWIASSRLPRREHPIRHRTRASCTVPSTEPLHPSYQPVADNDVPRPPSAAPPRQGA